MLRPVRGTLAALAFGSTVAVGVVFGTVCSVDRAGLSNSDASSSLGGASGGSLSTGGVGAGGINGGSGSRGTGGGVLGTGGAGSGPGVDGGGQVGGASGGNPGTGGSPGTGGAPATGGALGTGGSPGAGGDNAATGGAPGIGGAPGTGSGGVGTGGPGTGGTIGTGGETATGGGPGIGGAAATGGETGTGGALGGTGGTGGSHTPSCSYFPKGSSFVTPTDNLLHCYWTHGEGSDWDSSEAGCVSEGGTLATILSEQENMFVLGVLLQQPNFFTGTGVSLGATDGKASGDKSGVGTYAWVTGEPWGYQNWHMGQPDGSCMCQGNDSTCICDHWLVMINDGTWFSRADSVARPYICEAIAR